LSGLTHDLSPLLIDTDTLRVTWYDFCFGVTLALGNLSWVWQARRAGYSHRFTWSAVVVGTLAMILGIRLFHVVFYHPELLTEAPHKVLVFWKGGYASHGAVFGMTLFFLFWARAFRVPFLDLFDRFTFAGTIGVIFVRLGNFFNQEIIGTVTDVPWGVHFTRFGREPVYRHPVQLYELLLGLAVLALLLWADKRFGKEARPRGLLLGISIAVYFGGRLLLEFTKEVQAVAPDSALNMGQYLSLVPAAAGVWLTVRALRHRCARPAG
jgi:phosphatidylglycerol---prolipoprotein diacylglyceryl transferase